MKTTLLIASPVSGRLWIPAEFLKTKNPDWAILTENGITVHPDGSVCNLAPAQRWLLDQWLAQYGAAATEVVA